MNYLRAKKYDKKIMGSGNLLKLETWINALHTTHEDKRGHTEECISYGFGITCGKA